MRRAYPVFHQTCNNYHKKRTLCQCLHVLRKSLNHLDNQNMLQTTVEEILNKGNFFIGAIFWHFKWSLKQQPTNQHNCCGDKYWVVCHTQYQWNQHLLQNRLVSSQCYSRKPDQNSENKIRNNKINDHPKCIQWKQYTSKKARDFR